MKNPEFTDRKILWLLLLCVGVALGSYSKRELSKGGCGLMQPGALLAQNSAAPAEHGETRLEEDLPVVDGDAGSGSEPAVDYRVVARNLAEILPAAHLLREPFDEGKSALAWTNYFAALDFERMYFRQEDIDEFEGWRPNLGAQMRDGDLSFANLVYERYLERVEERVERLEELLKTPFDFSEEEFFMWKRREAPWPADLGEQDELWRKRAKNDMLVRIISRERKEAEAAERERAAEGALEAGAEDEPAVTEAVPEVAEAGGEREAPPVAAAGDAGAEGGEAGAEAAVEETDEEFVLKRYKRYLTILRDNDAEDPMTRFMNSVAMAFDPHTGYMSPAGLEDFGINMQLSLQGIGAQLRSEDGTARVMEIMPGGPAERDTRDIRLVPGDQIIGVGQGDEPIVDTLHWPLYKTVRLIRGPKGTKVTLLVQPASDPSRSTTKIVDLVRDEVKLEEQAATSSVEKVADDEGEERKLGIIRLPTFYSSMTAGGGKKSEHRGAALDVARLMAELNGESVEGMILDLRGNGGGALKEAIDLAGLFIRTGPVVLVKEGSRIHNLADHDPAIAFRKPVVVLIDRISASASEIVAGALQDYGRAVVVGDTRSHGKGTVQQIIPLDQDGKLGSVKITNASFYRINGSSTQARGVSADIVLPSVFDYFTELGEDKLPNAIPWSSIRTAWFRPVGDLSETIERLRENSLARREGNERWKRHERRLARFERMQNMKELPLQLEARRELSREERELDELEEDFELENSTRKEREAARRAKDVVLDEALRVLVDLIDAEVPMPALERGSSMPSGMDELFQRFFR